MGIYLYSKKAIDAYKQKRKKGAAKAKKALAKLAESRRQGLIKLRSCPVVSIRNTERRNAKGLASTDLTGSNHSANNINSRPMKATPWLTFRLMPDRASAVT